MQSEKDHIHLNEDPREARLLPAFIPDEHATEASSDRHPFPLEYAGHLADVMIEHSKIMSRCKELAQLINQDYKKQREFPSSAVAIHVSNTLSIQSCLLANYATLQVRFFFASSRERVCFFTTSQAS
jgi:hypothetical protein